MHISVVFDADSAFRVELWSNISAYLFANDGKMVAIDC